MPDNPERRTIRLFPDYVHPWPLWEDPDGPMEPEDFGLSQSLTESLSAWHQFWEEHHAPYEGWDQPENKIWWDTEGRDIAGRLGAEVAPFADVSYEGYWVDLEDSSRN
jgi:hypothetical protein